MTSPIIDPPAKQANSEIAEMALNDRSQYEKATQAFVEHSLSILPNQLPAGDGEHSSFTFHPLSEPEMDVVIDYLLNFEKTQQERARSRDSEGKKATDS
jgi:hypothetical protein